MRLAMSASPITNFYMEVIYMDVPTPTLKGGQGTHRAAAASRDDLGVIGNSSKFARRPRDISRSTDSTSVDGAIVTSVSVLVS